jgi:pyrroline-5-carboxylate reductase
MKLGILGCGNMGSAILSGIIINKLIAPEDIYIYDIDQHKVKEIVSKWKVNSVRETAEVAEHCDVIMIAVKPQDIGYLLESAAGKMDSAQKIVISIAAGVRVELIRKYLKKSPIARVMPNTPALIGKGAAGIYFAGDFTEKQETIVMDIFRACGTAEIVRKEDILDVVTGLSGSGPAYVFAFINSLADGAVMEGLPRDSARRLAIQTVMGSAELAWDSMKEGVHLEELKDRVTSPGGTTAAGLFALEEGKFRGTVIKAVREATKRSRELGK